MKKFKVQLSENDSKMLQEIAETFGCSESESILKGLKLMTVAAKLKQQGKSLLIKQNNEIQELIL